MSARSSGKFLALEAVRGVAACVVVVHHYMLAFLPHFHGRLFPDDSIALVRTPLFFFVNGTAAVAVFFVLSGFVLTVRAFQSNQAGGLVVGAFKRWPTAGVPRPTLPWTWSGWPPAAKRPS